MIRHVVFVKFRKDADPKQIDLLIEGLKKLPYDDPEIQNYSHGRCVEPRYHSGDFDLGVCCDFDGHEAMSRYMSHWAHLRLGGIATGIVQHDIAFNWEIDYYGPEFDPAKA